MKPLKLLVFILIFIVFYIADINGQNIKKDENKLSLSFQTGFSLLLPTNSGQNIFTIVQENISLGKSEFIFSIKFLYHHKLSVSLGKDYFNEEYDVYSGSLENPVFVQTSIRKIENYWLGFCYEYHFNRKKATPHLGAGIGVNDDKKILFVYTGINIDYLKPISLTVNLRYSKLYKTNNTMWFAKTIGSQIGIDFGVNYEF